MTTIAVAVGVEKDIQETNDISGQATPFGAQDITANLYRFRFNDGREIKDVDWYMVLIPAGTTYAMKVVFLPAPPVSATYNGFFEVIQEGGTLPDPITHNVPFYIANTGTSLQYIRFEIRPTDLFLNHLSGGWLLAYSIHNEGMFIP
jgi:hypothetical protein